MPMRPFVSLLLTAVVVAACAAPFVYILYGLYHLLTR